MNLRKHENHNLENEKTVKMLNRNQTEIEAKLSCPKTVRSKHMLLLQRKYFLFFMRFFLK